MHPRELVPNFIGVACAKGLDDWQAVNKQKPARVLKRQQIAHLKLARETLPQAQL
jgi:hypothetical protein